VRTARERVGSRPDGTSAQGEWVRSNGWAVRMHSGRGDEYFSAVEEFVANELPPRQRRAKRLATHVEVKVAVAMRREALTDETVVIDRQVCGTRDYDRDDPLTCDRYLSRLLPPGARLHVVEPDGTIRTYEGETKR
jgi:hypothetical protein